jgi:hypothetical protein
MSKTNATFVVELKSIRNKDAKHRNLKVGDCMDVYNTRKDYLPVPLIVDEIDGSVVHMHYPSEEEMKKFVATKEQKRARGLIDPEDLEDTENLISTSESTKKFGKKFDESYDSDYAKEKFFGIMMDELGLSQDEIEEMVEKWDEDYDAMNDIMLKFLDGKPLDRMEQIQAAYYLCDKLENHW